MESFGTAKARSSVVRASASASVVDLGNDVLAVELHSKMNTIDQDTLAILEAGVGEAEQRAGALVVGSEPPHFSAGANLKLLLRLVGNALWDEIERFIGAFQQTNLRLRTGAVPVVAAPHGLTLGGGCEMVLHADHVQAALDASIGLVETAIGLIPGAGGTKEIAARAAESTPKATDLLPAVRHAFEAVVLARISSGAEHARELGYLRDTDGITTKPERLLSDAKGAALDRVRAGYQPPAERAAIRVGGETVRESLAAGIDGARRAGRISEHDALIGRTLAGVMAGGATPRETTISEQQMLDLEREAFMRLLGEAKTIERIHHTLATGKLLRN